MQPSAHQLMQDWYGDALCKEIDLKILDEMPNRCGEQHGRFYDRKGDFFREGVDPRNHIGRFVEVERGHDDGCAAMYSYAERCNCSMNPRVGVREPTKINRVDKVYWLSDNNTVMRKGNA